FVFKNIGGTSAGAIAAAAAAAAEFRRQEQADLAGFEKLEQLPSLLIQQPGTSKRTRLFDLFQPSENTRRIFDVLTSGMGGQGIANAIGSAMRQYAPWALAGALPGGLLGILSHLYGSGVVSTLWMAVSLALALAGAVVSAGAAFLTDVIHEVPKHGFGLCSGMSTVKYSGADDAPAAALAVWLTGYLNETAGLPPDGDPLTFGQLWQADGGNHGQDDRSINLEMMTTNLTHRRPFRLPFRDDEDLRENAQFYFREEEFKQYFPGHVVRWMVNHPRPPGDDARSPALLQRLKAAGYLPMPAPEDLPVVVATRMSLSFPFLLCAVPLHAIDWSRVGNNPEARNQVLPERCWFSDGGMCSNFPLHFFDAALPRRPTFSIDLSEKPADTPEADLHPDMPKSNGANLSERWNRFDTESPRAPAEPPVERADLRKLLGFIWAMIGTMQNWTDTTQGRLPGYRDRIVSVPLKPDEGGLNLDMPQPLITALSQRGEEAAKLLEEHFDVPPTEPTMTWDNHRWIRLRAVLAALEKTLGQMIAALDHPESGDLCYEDWVTQIEEGQMAAPSYPMKKPQLDAARRTLAQLREIQALWSTANAAEGSPRPRPVLRPRPQV
ncbi:MAG: patatin-like phospholipase family protein, partial [Verrucomicrobiae bacterium]|nr:patatin-like phospholipase family protein [Verrucomicrobiae bacterium]